uniref:Coiled-coil domain containing 106b n=1 Tax=Scophthalmus maximus TaxID=52904 RepID=A0A8D3CE00_SCOMX
MPHSSSASSSGGGGGGGGLYLDAYEVSFPLEESIERPAAYHLGHGQQMMDGTPFILVSNLRAHLYVALEKNAWLQKRIEELEEERNFLRCQLDRFIVSMRSPDAIDICVLENKYSALSPFDFSCMQSSRNTIWRKINTTPRMSTWRKRRRRRRRRTRRWRRGRRRKGEPTGSRVKDPDGVLIRYQKILTTYQRVRSMSRAFQIHGVDRNTMASTSPIAELLLVAPEKVEEVGEFEASKEKLLDYARRCYKTMDEPTHAKVQGLKKTHKLLPISYRFRN